MKEIAPGVYLMEDTRVGNVYLLADAGRLMLVDAGMAGDVDRIVAQIEAGGYDPQAVETIVITHAHTDHIGGLPELVQRTGAEVWTHRAEAPALDGSEPMPAGSGLRKLLGWLSNILPSKNIPVARKLEADETLDILGGLRVLHTPGHSPGSLCLYQEARGILFCGDLIFNGNPFTGRGGLRYPPKAFSIDHEQVKASVRQIAALNITVLCSGHGAPLTGDVNAKINALIASEEEK